MKRILIITRDVQPNAGVGRYSVQVLRTLVQKGYRPTVLVERGVAGHAALEGVVVRSVLFPERLVYVVWVNFLLVRIYARGHDLVHALDGWPYGAYGYAAVVGTSRRLFVSALGTYAVAPLNHKIKGALLSRAYQRATRVFCISAYTERRVLDKISLTNTMVVHLATSKFTSLSSADKAALVAQYPKAACHPLFLTVGQIKERKGQLDTLKALALLKEMYPDFLYVIIGAGELKNYIAQIESFAAEHGLTRNVLIISDSRDDRVPAFFYEQCDVFLLNSNTEKGHFEGFGLVILEAAQYGKPAVGSSGSGIEDAILDGYSGFLTTQKDHKDIADKIQHLMQQHDTFSKNAYEFSTRFSWEKTVQQYIDAYEA